MANPYDLSLTDGQELDLDTVNQALTLGGVAPVTAPALTVATIPQFQGSVPGSREQQALFRDQQVDDARTMELLNRQAAANIKTNNAMADEFGKQSSAEQAVVDESNLTHEHMQERRQRFEQDMDGEYENLRQSYAEYAEGAQPSNFSHVMAGVGGALMAIGGNRNSKVLGKALVDSVSAGVDNDMKALARQVEAAKGSLDAAKQMGRATDESAESRARESASIINLVAQPYETALEKLKFQTKNDQERLALEHAQLALRGQVRAKYNEIHANSYKQDALRANQKRMAQFYGMSDADLAAAARQDKLALKVYKERLGIIDTESEIEGQRAKAAKDANEGGPQRVTVDGTEYEFKTPVEKTTITEIAKNTQAMAAVRDNLREMAAIRERNKGGTTNDTDEARASQLMTENSGLLSQMNGMGAPSEGERNAIIKGMVDPTGFYFFSTDPAKSYKTQIEGIERKQREKMRSLGATPVGSPVAQDTSGFKPVTGAPQTSTSAPASSGALINMFNPSTGESKSVHPGWRSKFESEGFVVGRPSDTAPTKPPYEEGAGTRNPNTLPSGGVGSH